MSEEEIFCAKCNCRTDQTLVMACSHNLCMSCAAENLTRQETSGINKTQFVICDFCKSKTEVDTETSKEILQIAMGHQSQNQNNEENYILDKNFLNFENNNQEMQQQNIPQSFSPNFGGFKSMNEEPPQQSAVNLVYFEKGNNNCNMNASMNSLNSELKSNICPEHNEPITYLCLDCLSKCICSECVVHGIHKNHEVLNIKKAYPMIYNKSQDLGMHVLNKIKELKNVNKVLEKKKQDIYTLNERCKNDIKNCFEQIKNKINEKEKEILCKTENTFKDNISELNTYNRVIQSKILALNKLTDSINAHLLRKDELTLINFYCENKHKILNQTELNELTSMPDVDAFSNTKIDIDKGSFDVMLNALNSLRFEINNIKGIDIDTKIDMQKYRTQRNLYGTNNESVKFTPNYNTDSNNYYNTYNGNNQFFSNFCGTKMTQGMENQENVDGSLSASKNSQMNEALYNFKEEAANINNNNYN